MGGVFNSRNLQTYHYAGNNPIKYVDPTGRDIEQDPEYKSPVQEQMERVERLQNIVDNFYSPEWDKIRQDTFSNFHDWRMSALDWIGLGLTIWTIVELGFAIAAVISGGGALIIVYFGAKEGTKQLVLHSFKNAVKSLALMMGREWLTSFHLKHSNKEMTEVEYWENALIELEYTEQNGTEQEKKDAQSAKPFIKSQIQKAKDREEAVDGKTEPQP
ncbi:hypothetical protein PVA45_05895 [Entomospira entomophila]|nr:hypothetical protein [Entomospira entomophilus]WDI35242.1 hypothetical protein PVA45_05895 [Entomospira entomophilus]